MKNGKLWLRGMLALALMGAGSLGATTLEEDFDAPPQSRGAYAWWHWCGGNVSKPGITRDLEAMKAAGLAGATVFFVDALSNFSMDNAFDPAMTYRSDRWWELFGFAAAEAKRLGLELGYCNGAGYSCSGGPWITPELSMKKLVWTKAAKGTKPARPEAVLGFYRDIAEIEAGGEVYRFGYTSTGKCLHPVPAEIAATALEADKMSAKAMNLHWDHAIGEVVRRVKPSRPGLTHVMMDSYEAGDHDWTDDFRDEFRRRRGYDPVPMLPVLAGASVKGGEADAKFKEDMRTTKHELLTENHYRLFRRRAAEAGLEMHLEPYTGDFDAMEASRAADVVMTEFWAFPVSWAPDPEKFGGGVWHCGPVGRAQGRPIIGAESFTAMPMDDTWSVAPKHLKRQTDATFARGVNRLSLHHWVHQPLDPKYAPGFTMGFWGTHFGECQTWFEPGKAFYRYLQRCQAMLQRGEAVVDVLAVDEGAAEGETVDAVTKAELLAGDVKVGKDGELVLPSGRRYRYLRMPWSYRPSEAVMDVIDELVGKGARLWRAGMESKGPFWVETARSRDKIMAAARREGETEFFFVANTARSDERFVARFRVRGKRPELWWPESGRRELVPDGKWEATDEGVRLLMRLPRETSCFVVFRTAAAAPKCGLRERMRHEERRWIGGEWLVEFESGRGAPTGERTYAKLADWTESDDEGIRHFSGTATYRTTFGFALAKAKSERVGLRLNEVCDIAEVELNGCRVGVAWHAPFELDVTGFLREGNNELVVKVTNSWANRLIGDEAKADDATWFPGEKMLGCDQKWHETGMGIKRLPDWLLKGEARPSGRIAFSTWNYFKADSKLFPSGLIGPVCLFWEADGTYPHLAMFKREGECGTGAVAAAHWLWNQTAHQERLGE